MQDQAARAGSAGGDDGLRDRVESKVQDLSGGAGDAAGQAGEKARELAGQATQAAQEAGGRAGDMLRARIDERTGMVGERLSAGAADLRTLADELRQQEKDGPARLATQAAERAERLGGYLSSADSNRMLRDLEDLGRRQPWTVALGALAVGFAAARFLNASSGGRSGGLPSGAGAGAGRPAGAPQMQPGGYMPDGDAR